jgi:hypothetical protein
MSVPSVLSLILEEEKSMKAIRPVANNNTCRACILINVPFGGKRDDVNVKPELSGE